MHRIPRPTRPSRVAIFLLGPLVLSACGPGPAPVTTSPPAPPDHTAPMADPVIYLSDRSAPTTALIQAVSAADDGVVWASGHSGRWLRSLDGGETWTVGRGPGGDSLQFRDVDAFDASTAYLMSAGTGPASRIYRTDDGGDSWMLQYLEGHPDGFLDCMAFWDRETGVVYGDAVDGSLFVLRTGDGGATWSRLPAEAVPAAQEGEAGFAASGTCAMTAPDGRGWIVTGNVEHARILSTSDRGLTWTATEPPVVGGEGAGLTTVAVSGDHGVALGGVLHQPEARGRYVTVTADGGATWTDGGDLVLPGAVYGAAMAPDLPGPVVVAVGPGGMDWSVDGGVTWRGVDDRSFWAVGFGREGVGWAVGPNGLIVRVQVTDAAEPTGAAGGPQAASESSPSSR